MVNAAGAWAQPLAALAGVNVPVLPRRGVVLVTQPLPPLIRRKVYAAEYVSNVASDAAGLESSAVVEGTPSGTVLIGASRERVGFDPGMPVPVVRRLATQAVALFPVLAGARLLRTYRGYRSHWSHRSCRPVHPRSAWTANRKLSPMPWRDRVVGEVMVPILT